MVQVAQVDADAQQSSDCKAGAAAQPLAQGLFPNGVNEVCQYHKSHYEKEIVGHLDVVAQDLQSGEDARKRDAPQVTPLIAERHTGNGGRDEAQCEQFPDMSGGDDDEIVTAESPKDCAQRCHPNAEVKRTQHNVKAQQHHEHIGGHFRQSQLVDAFDIAQRACAGVRRAHLIGGHSAEQRVCPSCTLAVVLFAVLFHFHVGANGGTVVMAGKHQSVANGRQEVQYADGHEEQHGQHIGDKFFHFHVLEMWIAKTKKAANP